MKYLNYISIVVIVFFTINVNAQLLPNKQITNTVEQNNISKLNIENQSINITTDNAFISEKYFLEFDNNPTVTLENISVQNISPANVQDNVKLENSFTPKIYKAFEQKKPIVFVQIPKYIKSASGQYQQLVNYKVQLTNGTPIKNTRGSRVYATNSVLASGNWYKVAVNQRGMQKIDYDFVKNKLGINPANITPSAIAVYGNGGQLIPESNITKRADDLVENPIELVGMQDGTFDNGDYILFYANGPFTISYDSIAKLFHQSINIYDDNCHYFINFNKANAMRIIQNTFSGTPTTTVTSFNDFQYLQKDSSNIGGFGKQWWGDQFGNRLSASLNKSYNFNFPNIIASEPVNINCVVGAAGDIQSYFTATANGVSIGTVGLNGSSSDQLFNTGNFNQSINSTTDNININLQYTAGNETVLGYLDYIEINAKRKLSLSGSQTLFADFNSIANNAIAKFIVDNTDATAEVWDITNQLNPSKINGTWTNNQYQFVNDASIFHQYICFSGSNFPVPTFEEKTENQNIHSLSNIDYLIVTNPLFINQANALAKHHQYKRGLKTLVVTTKQVYNEFSSGSQDISAIRDFAKMFYDKATNQNDMPKNMLLFGDGSFDYKNRISVQNNFVPTRETDESSNRSSGYCSDDFFGILDDNENINAYTPNTLDIGIGRLTADDENEANNLINKIFLYDSSISFGAWRNNLTFCGDNGQGNIHSLDADYMSSIAADSIKNDNIYKIYIDAFPVFPTPGGNRSPEAKENLDAQIYNGTFVVNYNGHGSPSAWCDERIFTTGDISSYTNLYKLPLFITATCDFGAFDAVLKSGAEKLLSYNSGGAIALMTTTQLVYQYENRIMNSDYWKMGFDKMPNGKMPTLGDAFRISKNKTYINSSSNLDNFRKFALLGDPALQLSFPKLLMVADSLNNKSLSQVHDTLKALNIYNLKGRVLNENNTTATDFNGTADITIFDKVKQLSTLGNDGDSPKFNYTLQNGTVYKGKVNVANGIWAIKFIVPKDIDYSYGFGKISMYAASNSIDATGYDNRVAVGGTGNINIIDNVGPTIKPFLNNTKFVNGGITGKNSILILNLKDDNGINTTGGSIGHDITAVLDGNTSATIVLNNYYEPVKDSISQGTVHYPLKNIAVGKHTLTLKAWDILNNSSQASLDFIVQDENTAQLEHIYNYPNPFTTKTNFCFEHNYPGQTLYVTIQIFSVSGQLIRSIRQVVSSEGSRVDNIEWDGKDEMGDNIGRGVYLYKLHYKTVTGISVSKYQKLIKL